MGLAKILTKDSILEELPILKDHCFEIRGTTKDAQLLLFDEREGSERVPTFLYLGSLQELKAYAWGVAWAINNSHLRK